VSLGLAPLTSASFLTLADLRTRSRPQPRHRTYYATHITFHHEMQHAFFSSSNLHRQSYSSGGLDSGLPDSNPAGFRAATCDDTLCPCLKSFDPASKHIGEHLEVSFSSAWRDTHMLYMIYIAVLFFTFLFNMIPRD